MQNLRIFTLITVVVLVSNNLFGQGIPKANPICDSLLQQDINNAFALSDSGAFYEALYDLGVSSMPQSAIKLVTTTAGPLTIISVGGNFPEIIDVLPVKKWLNATTGCPTLVAVTADEKTMVRIIYEE